VHIIQIVHVVYYLEVCKYFNGVKIWDFEWTTNKIQGEMSMDNV